MQETRKYVIIYELVIVLRTASTNSLLLGQQQAGRNDAQVMKSAGHPGDACIWILVVNPSRRCKQASVGMEY